MPHTRIDAVAPVVGVLLVTFVVVLMSGIVSAFAFALVPDVTRTVAVAVAAEQSGGDVVLTYEGGREVPSLAGLDVTVTAPDGTVAAASFAGAPPAVGATLTVPGAGTPGQDRVVVVAQLVDGSRHVVLDREV